MSAETIVIDPWELDNAAQHATAMFDAAHGAARQLLSMAGGVEMPPDVAGRISTMLAGASTTLESASAIIQASAVVLSSVAGKGRTADRISKEYNAAKAIANFHLDIFASVDEELLRGKWAKVGKVARARSKGSGSAIAALVRVAQDQVNPFLTAHQRTARAARSGLTAAAIAQGVKLVVEGGFKRSLVGLSLGALGLVVDYEAGLQDAKDGLAKAAENILDAFPPKFPR